MKKTILLMLAILLVMPMIVAPLTELGTFEQDKSVVLRQLCDNCTYVNITSVTYPNGTPAITDVAMTKRGTDYNYTLASTYTNPLGTYTVNGVGDDNGVNTTWAYNFEITFNGEKITIPQAIIYVIFIVAILFSFVLTLYGSIMISWRNPRNPDGYIIGVNELRHFKVFCIVMSYILLMFFFGITKSILENYLFMNGAYVIFNILYWIMFSGVFPIMVVALMVFIVGWLSNIKIKTELDRGAMIK